MEAPMELTSFGQPKKILGTVNPEATAVSVDSETPNPKPCPESNNVGGANPAAAGPEPARDLPAEISESNKPHETAIDLPPPPPELTTFGQPATTADASTEATATIIDTEAPSAKSDAESNNAAVAKDGQAVPPSTETKESSNVPPEAESTSPPLKLSTFGQPISAIPVASDSQKDTQVTEKDQTPTAGNELNGAGTTTTQDQAPKADDSTSLSKDTGASPGVDESAPPGDAAAGPKAEEERHSVKGTETEAGKGPGETGTESAVLSDETGECNSVESGMKLRSFSTDLNTMFVAPDAQRKFNRTRFVVLCTMGIATVMLVLVAVGLVLLARYTDLSKLWEPGSGPESKSQQVMMIGEAKIFDLEFSTTYADKSSKKFKSLEEKFVKTIDELFEESNHSEIYNKTRVDEFRNGSVIVAFRLSMKPIPQSQASGRGRGAYKNAYSFLRKKLNSVMIDLNTYSMSVIQLNLTIGNASVPVEGFEEGIPTTIPTQPPTTTQLSMSQPSTINQMSASQASTNKVSTTQPSTSEIPTEQTSIILQTTGNTELIDITMSSTDVKESTSRASTSAIPTMSPAANESSTTTNTTVAEQDNTIASSAEMTTTQGMATTEPPTTARTRRKRSTLFTADVSTTLSIVRRSTTLLMSQTPRLTDEVIEGCFPNPLRGCVRRGWSTNATRTPNRFGLANNTAQIWHLHNALSKEIPADPGQGEVMQRFLCSLLAPSCDGNPIGPSLPCRSLCLDVVGSMRDTVEARALGALCNESLPESESETICFKASSQDSGSPAQPDGSLCPSQFCLNGGTCFDMNGRAYCRCPTGFGGVHCQIDPCASSPCQNGGTCRGHADFIVYHLCECSEGYHGKNCELSTDDPLPTRIPGVSRPTPINVSACRDLLPYNDSISDSRVPDWRVVAPLASCSDEAQLIFCAMAHPEFEDPALSGNRQMRAPCRAVCERVFAECDTLFALVGRTFPGICERLGTIPTDVKSFCTDKSK